jgi:hypothetical protein
VGLLFFLWDYYRPSTRWEPNSAHNHGILFRPACQAEARTPDGGGYAGRLEETDVAHFRAANIFLQVFSTAGVTKAVGYVGDNRIERATLGAD